VCCPEHVRTSEKVAQHSTVGLAALDDFTEREFATLSITRPTKSASTKIPSFATCCKLENPWNDILSKSQINHDELEFENAQI
jgi:hypothetical protein